MAIELTYRVLGEATERPPLIILHGLLGSAGNWRPLARKLSKRQQVFCLNLRNHGDSPHLPGMSYPELADDVLAFLDLHDFDQVDLLGHSMGGKTAMTLALLHADRISRLIVVDTAPVTYTNLPLDMPLAMEQVDLSMVTRRSDAEDQLRSHIGNAQLRSFVLTNLARKDEGYVWRVNLPVILQSLESISGFPDFEAEFSYADDTLFLGGERSAYMKDYRQEIMSRFPKAQIKFIERASHWPHADQPQPTLEVLQRFLNGDAL